MAYTLTSGEILIEVRGQEYVVGGDGSPSAFYLKDPGTGNPTAVSADLAAELYGAERAWALLHRFFVDLHVENNAANWDTVLAQAVAVKHLETGLSWIG